MKWKLRIKWPILIREFRRYYSAPALRADKILFGAYAIRCIGVRFVRTTHPISKCEFPCDFGPKITRNSTYTSHPKIGLRFLIYAKNDANEEKEKEKENVGIFSPNSTFFGDQKNRERELNLHFF